MKTLKANLTLAGLVIAFVVGCAAPQSANKKSGAPAPTPTLGQPDAGKLRAYIALLRSDLKTQKTLIIAENISFTDDEAIEFWPLHSEYTLELNQLLDERLYLLHDYAGTYKTMTDAQASALAKKVFDLEAKRTDLKRTWFKKFAKVVAAKKAAQFFQIENQINAALDLQLAAALPLIE